MRATNTRSFVVLVSFLLCNGFQALNAQSNKYVVKIVARPLPLSAVRITGGPLKRAQKLLLTVNDWENSQSNGVRRVARLDASSMWSTSYRLN